MEKEVPVQHLVAFLSRSSSPLSPPFPLYPFPKLEGSLPQTQLGVHNMVEAVQQTRTSESKKNRQNIRISFQQPNHHAVYFKVHKNTHLPATYLSGRKSQICQLLYIFFASFCTVVCYVEESFPLQGIHTHTS